MKYLLIVPLLFGCGYTARHINVIGQVKFVQSRTPLICPEYNEADLSLGVMKNGTGSISRHDANFLIANDDQKTVLDKALADGSLVKITYDSRRVAICVPHDWITKVEIE